MFAQLKRTIIGSPIATEQAVHERLNKRTALAVFSSDALSSVAYATQEILIHLAPAGLLAFAAIMPISLVIVALLLVVGISYRQTIRAYPNGGGSYIVAKENLGMLPGLTAGAALLIDYVLTVAVSIAAGVEAAYSAIPALEPYRVWICLAVIVLITLANLRGVRESGTIFAIPTYFFILTFVGMIIYGLVQYVAGTLPPHVADLHGPLLGARGPLDSSHVERTSLFFLLAAFASGCTAMTGVEAISNGVPAFKKPESDNARTTLTGMIVILVTMFVGISFLARKVGAEPHASGLGADAVINETIPSQVARTVFHGRNLFFFGVQAATALILVLAANTSYADFPRLTQLIARDRYMPKQFASLGDRLVFSNGILILAVLSSLLIIVFKASVNGLIPLYAVGVFLSFTLSQAGMVRHWFRLRGRHWHLSAVVNGVGAAATFVVLIIIGSTKFLEGAWLVVLLIPVLVMIFLGIHHHYRNVAEQLTLKGMTLPPPVRNTVIVPISTMHRGVVNALQYAKAISDDVTAVHISDDPEEAAMLREKWKQWGDDVPLEIIESPYRSLMRPLIKYIEEVDSKHDNDVVTVVLPEFVTRRWWHHLLHNQTSLRLKGALLYNKDIVVTSVPYRLRR